MLGVTRIFKKWGLPCSSKDDATKTSSFLCPAPLFARCLAVKVRIIKFDDTVQLMQSIPLPHSSTDASEHGPSGFIGRTKHCRQLSG